MMRVLHEEHRLSDLFILYVVSGNIGIDQDLVDQLFNSSEKTDGLGSLDGRPLRRTRHTRNCRSEISQAPLAEMIGTTRSRVSFVMNKFRKRGRKEIFAQAVSQALE